MKPTSSRCFACLFIACLPALLLAEEDSTNWGHWRGPEGNGVSLTANPPTQWSTSQNIKWKVPVPGKGSGSPVVWGDRIFVVSAVDVGGGEAASDSQPRQQPQRSGRRGRGSRSLSMHAFKVLCFQKDNGQLLWEQTAVEATPHQSVHETHGFSSASPCTDGEYVYAHFGSRGLYCYTMDGGLKWKRDDFGKMMTRNDFGEGSSPTIEGDLIIVPWDHEGPSFLYALNKNTGETIWKTERDEPSCWATPLVVEHNGRKQIVTSGQNFARGYDLESGHELWRCAGQTQRPVASPVAGHNLAFVGSGYQGEFLGAFRLGGKGDIEGSKDVAWTVSNDTPDIASLLLSGRRLYYHKGKSGMLSCTDAVTGEAKYTAQRVAGLDSIYASPIAAGGNVYLTSRAGTTVVIKDADKFEIVSTNSVGETVDATPAPVGDELFIRGEQHLFCIANQ